MKKLMMAVMVAACAANVPAMPTKQEMAKAQPLVNELMAPALAKFKAAGYKEKTAEAAKVGDASSAFAKAAETEAAKFLLLKGAVGFYVRGEQYDKAADTIETLRREVKDVTPAVIAEITGKAAGKISETKAPRLYALYRSAKLQVRAGDEAKALAAKLKKVQSDLLQRKYAEALAVSGDWKAAYAEFAKVGNAKLKEIAKDEAAGKAKSAEAGEFWWGYEPAMEDAEDFFKSHAAAYYRKALDAGEITGLKKNIVEQRIKGIAVEIAKKEITSDTTLGNGLYCIVDVSGGIMCDKYPVSYMSQIPQSGWTDEYKTDRIVFRLIKPGKFKMGDCAHSGKNVVDIQLTKSYYIGVFEITQRQWELVMGDRPSLFSLEKSYAARPLDRISYQRIRGKDKGTSWPSSSEVDADSFMGRLRAKTGLEFDLPTEAQWEYACRSMKTTDLGTGKNINGERDENLDEAGRYGKNGGWNEKEWGKFKWQSLDFVAKSGPDNGTAPVGSYKPNAWGLYDMHGNVNEWCLDRTGNLVSGKDPCGASTGDRYVIRGGSWLLGASECTSWWRGHLPAHWNFPNLGFRAVIREASSLPSQSAATTVAAPSSGKAWQEKGNTAWLTLPNGEKLEFAKCPAGNVDIGVGIRNWDKYPKTKSVRITRPFWIMVSPLARRHFKGYPAYTAMFGDKDESPFNYCEGYYDDVMGFANALTEEVKSSLPKGCVIRLPSFAEWEYSFRAGSRDPNDPYANFDISRRKENSARCRECFYFAGEWGKWDDDLRGKTKKNNLGLHDFWREKLLDRVDASNAIPTKEGWQFGRDKDNRSKIEALRADAIDHDDPLLWSENDDALPLQRGQDNWGYLQGRHKWNYSRLVVGPDLVSEWRAKHGKK